MKKHLNVIIASLTLIILSSCSDRLTRDEIIEKKNKLENETLNIFKNWHIYPYHGHIVFKIYYEHNDSSKYYIKDDGEASELTKYEALGFSIKEDNGVYYFDSNNVGHSVDETADYLSLKTGIGKDYFVKVLPELITKYYRLKIPEINGKPFYQDRILFHVDRYSKLFLSMNDTDHVLLSRDYEQIAGKWYLK